MFWGQKWVENEFLGDKNKGPCFSGHHSGWISGCMGDVSVVNIGLIYLLDPSNQDWFIGFDIFVRPK